jgi:hypothetical protein
MYTVAGTYAWYARENAAEVHLAALEDLRRVMRTIGRSKWRVGCKFFCSFLRAAPAQHASAAHADVSQLCM